MIVALSEIHFVKIEKKEKKAFPAGFPNNKWKYAVTIPDRSTCRIIILLFLGGSDDNSGNCICGGGGGGCCELNKRMATCWKC